MITETSKQSCSKGSWRKSAGVGWGTGVLCLAVSLALPPGRLAAAGGTAELWPLTAHAHYRLHYNGIDVGHIDMTSNVSANSYSMAGTGKVSVLFGAIVWTGSSKVAGAIENGTPSPGKYAFEWRQNKKAWSVDMGFKDRVASEIAVSPPPKAETDHVPLTPAHKSGALDPVSALMMLTKADGRPPCERRLAIFDGKQRYDIVFSYKRLMRLAPKEPGGASTLGYVCRAVYEPIAGHRANETTAGYAAKRDIEVVMRKIPGSEMLIPHSVNIPTPWGTGSMVMKHVDVVTQGAGKVALTE